MKENENVTGKVEESVSGTDQISAVFKLLAAIVGAIAVISGLMSL